MKTSTKYIKEQAEGIFRAYCTGRHNNKALRSTTEAEQDRFDHYFKKLMDLHKEAETETAHNRIDSIAIILLDRHLKNLEYLRNVGR